MASSDSLAGFVIPRDTPGTLSVILQEGHPQPGNLKASSEAARHAVRRKKETGRSQEIREQEEDNTP